MNLRGSSAVLIIGLLSVACSQAVPDVTEGLSEADRTVVEAQLYAMEDEWIGNHRARDRAVLERILADDLIYTMPDGQVYRKDDYIEMTLQDPLEYDSVRIERMETHWYGNTAVVIGLGVLYPTPPGTMEGSGGQFTNVFVKRDGVWEVVVGHLSILP